MRFPYKKLLILASLILPISLLVSAGTGAYALDPIKIPSILWFQQEGYDVLMSIRFPRVIMAAIVGACLAMAGAAMQGLFRNPLADPSFIGVTTGAGFGAGLWLVFFEATIIGFWGMPLAAFLSAIVFMATVWWVAREKAEVKTHTLLLAGIAFNSLAFAGIGVLTFIADDQQLRSITFWLLGGLNAASWRMILCILPTAFLGMTILLFTGHWLNVFSLGEREAFHLGISVRTVKRLVFIGTALSVASAVTAAGGISFIGLVVPHLIRLISGADYRYLLPNSALGGAILLIVADTIARTIIQPAELPVGIMTALVGCPFFLWLLGRNRKEVSFA